MTNVRVFLGYVYIPTAYRISFNVVSNAVTRSKRSDREAPRVQAHMTPRIIFPVEFSVIRITSIQ